MLPSWIANPVDAETAIEITLLVSPMIDFSQVEDSRDVSEYIRAMVEAFQSKHRDSDWNCEDYLSAIESFVDAYIAADPVHFIRA